ncbi:MAG: enoyl-CoA hydratase/isomerase family protein [Nitrospirota bacterium]
MDLQLLNVTETDSITTIHLDKLDNGLVNMKAISELTDVLHYLEDESKCKFVIFRGSKACFGRGLDVDNFYPAKIDYDGFRKWEAMLRTIEKLNKITMAVLEGDCYGGAIDLALTCDVRIAAEDTKFSHDEMSKGILPGQTIFQLGKFCGLGKMLELIQTGRVYTAKEAVEMGIINRSYSTSRIEEGIAEIIEKYETNDINIHMLSRRLSKESYSIVYDNFIGGYLAAQHRVLSLPDVAGSDETDDDEII